MVPLTHVTQHPKLHLSHYSRFCTVHGTVSLYLTPPFCPTKLPLCKGIWTPSNIWFLGPTRVHPSNGILIGIVVFAWLTIMTDRPTERPRYSVCNVNAEEFINHVNNNLIWLMVFQFQINITVISSCKHTSPFTKNDDKRQQQTHKADTLSIQN